MGFMPEYVNNEVDFCKVRDLETKKKVESALLKYRISYFVDFKNRFFKDKSEKYTFRINRDFVEQATAALSELDCKSEIHFVENIKKSEASK